MPLYAEDRSEEISNLKTKEERSKISKLARNRGKTWERAVAKMFATVLGGSWLRVPNSGAFFGGKNSKRVAGASKTQAEILRGDIIVDDNYKHLIIECKNHKDVTLRSILKGGNKKFDSFLQQVSHDAAGAGDGVYPLLICNLSEGIKIAVIPDTLKLYCKDTKITNLRQYISDDTKIIYNWVFNDVKMSAAVTVFDEDFVSSLKY